MCSRFRPFIMLLVLNELDKSAIKECLEKNMSQNEAKKTHISLKCVHVEYAFFIDITK